MRRREGSEKVVKLYIPDYTPTKGYVTPDTTQVAEGRNSSYIRGEEGRREGEKFLSTFQTTPQQKAL